MKVVQCWEDMFSENRRFINYLTSHI